MYLQAEGVGICSQESNTEPYCRHGPHGFQLMVNGGIWVAASASSGEIWRPVSGFLLPLQLEPRPCQWPPGME